MLPIEILLRKVSKPKLSGLVLSSKNTRIPNANVKILNKTSGKTDKLQTNANGEFEYALDVNSEYEILANGKGYKASNTEKIVTTNELRPLDIKLQMIPIESEVIASPISTGTIIVLEKIYYDFDKAIIRQGAAQELDALVSLLQQYPSMEVELTSHTDSRGKTEYNQKLSATRAEAAKNYLIARDISGIRITARGAGESQLRNNCADGMNCSEEEHQYNRRTEVRITKMNEAAVKVEYGDKGPEVINGKN